MHDTFQLLKPMKSIGQSLDRLIQGRLWAKVLLAMFLGILLGLMLGPDLNWVPAPTVNVITAWLAMPGQVFLAVIQMIVVPLVLASIVRGLAANNDPQALKKNGGVALLFIMVSTALATVIGIGLALIFEPGSYVQVDDVMRQVASTAQPAATQSFPPLAELPNKMIALIPRNPLSSMVTGEMLQVILFAAILGVALLSIPAQQARPLFELLGALQEVSIRVVSWAMLLAPIAVFGLITKLVANLGIEVLAGMAMYVGVVLLGMLAMAGFYLLVVALAGAGPVRQFLGNVKELLLLAFSTSSSAAVMPLSLQTCEERLHLKPEIVRFLIPLGATINMTGTALYQGVATLFLAQVFGIDLSLTSYVFIITMAVAASIGSPATPGAGIVILSVILEGVGIPAAGMALLLGVDRILDMCRTAINVLGDVTACVLVQKVVSDTSPTEITQTPQV